MKRCTIILAMTLAAVIYAQDFDRYFVDATMRIDYYHTGDAFQDWVAIDQIYRQGIWAGSEKNLLDKFNNGCYYAKIYDCTSGKLIFSKGFDSYFKEYQTTKDAHEKIMRTYSESVLIPYAKKPIRFALEKRDDKNVLKTFFSQKIDPNAISIIKEPLSNGVETVELVNNGDPHSKVDIAIIAVGYTLAERDKFASDARHIATILLEYEPYKSYRDNFNIYGVYKASQQSGCDQPRFGSYKNTNIDLTFNSLGSMRYLMTEDNKTMRDIAAHVPYDTLYLMVNHDRYGGGGIYNLYATFPVDNEWIAYLAIHEFGHSFAGLGDEYYSSSTSYIDFYRQGIEPVEPNITALVGGKLKWKKFADPKIAIPTPWGKENYDQMSEAYSKKRVAINDRLSRLKREKAPEEEIAKVEENSRELSRGFKEQVERFMHDNAMAGKVGAFEGAGYVPKGLYRPALDCIMFSKGKKNYCPVCREAIICMIKHYSE